MIMKIMEKRDIDKTSIRKKIGENYLIRYTEADDRLVLETA